MLMMSRAMGLKGKHHEMLRLGTEITAIINSTSNLEMSFWRQVFGPTPGIVAWTAMVDSRVTLVEETAKFTELPEYVELAHEFQSHATPPVDAIRDVINYEEGWPGPPPFASMVIWQGTGDPRVTEWALELASHVSGMFERPMGVSVNTVGPMGQWAFHTGADTLAELEANSTAMWADPDFIELTQAANGLFVPGHGGQWTYARVD